MKKSVCFFVIAALLILIIGYSAAPQKENQPTEPEVYTYDELTAMPDEQLLDLFVANGLEIDESLVADLGMEEIQQMFKMHFHVWHRGLSTLSDMRYFDLAQQTAEIYARICSDSPDATLPVEPTLSILPSSFELGSPMYVKGYDSIGELMEDVALIVRAKPIAIETESEFAICYVLDVAESSVEGIETVYLRQMKDEHLLEIGQEVVLALAPDEGEGYYHIPAGGAGLFTANDATAEVEGELLDDLLKNSPASLSADASVTLDDIFDLLCSFE